MTEQTEPFREAGDFQDFLAGGRIPQKTSRHEIDEGVMIVEVAEKFFHLPEAGLLGDFHFPIPDSQFLIPSSHFPLPDSVS